MRWSAGCLALAVMCGCQSQYQEQQAQIRDCLAKAEAFVATAQKVSDALQADPRSESVEIRQALDQYNNLPNIHTTFPLPNLMVKLTRIYIGIEMVNQDTQNLKSPAVSSNPEQVASRDRNTQGHIARLARSIEDAIEEIRSLRKKHGIPGQ